MNATNTTEALVTPSTSSEMASSSLEVLTSSMSTILASSLDTTTTSAPMAAAKTYADQLDFVMSAVIGPIVSLLGMAGNILAVVTWCRPSMVSSTGRWLTGQAVADFFVLFFFLVVDSLQAWRPDIVQDKVYGVFFCYIGYPFFFFFIITSIWFTVGVTTDRYIMVCWIARAKKICKTKYANFGMLLIAVNCFLINIPHFTSFTPRLDLPANSTGTAFEKTEFQKSSGGMFYEFWIHCIILILVPWVTVLSMNYQIIKKVSASNKKMSDNKSDAAAQKAKDAENQITRLLLAVTFTFLFFIGLQCIIQCMWMQRPYWADMVKVQAAFAFAKTGIVFNSASNFLLYCLTGKRFRRELFKTLGCFRGAAFFGSDSHHSSSNNTTSTTGI